MSVALYMDVHVPMPITSALRLRAVDVLTAQEDGTDRFSDSDLLDRSGELRRVLVTSDKHFLKEASERLRRKQGFGGVIFVHCATLSLGYCTRQLELYALAGEEADFVDALVYL